MEVKHTLDAIYDYESRILILGTMPSVKSREVGFYYAHPKNRFWHILETVFDEKIKDKKEFILSHHLALYDVLESCTITGSSDSSIKKESPSNIQKIIANSKIDLIITTGKTAHKYYQKYFKDILIQEINLPSTSPANCAMKFEELVQHYQIIKEHLSE